MNCTGVRPASFAYDFASNTHPVQEYGSYKVVWRGGALYHRAVVTGGTGQGAKAIKTGRACNYSLLWLVAFGNSGINQARKAGKIQKIALVEYDIYSIGAVLYNRFCTIVHGE